MSKIEWINFLREINNLEMFSLCKDFDELTLEEKVKEKVKEKEKEKCTVSFINRLVRPLHYFDRSSFNSLSISPWCQAIVKQLQAPFLDFPSCLIPSFPSYDIHMGFGFRFLPGQSEFLLKDLQFPETHMERLSFLSNSLGLSYKRNSLSSEALFSYTSSGSGLRCLVTKINKILVESISYYNGRYWRILVQVSLGIGCTVWYMCEPGSPHHAPVGGLFVPLDSYEPFFQIENYTAPGFRRVSFLESHDVSASVESAMGTEVPFAEISIPATGPVLKAVGLGVMVAFFIVVGLVPDLSEGVQFT